jgi:hypothetical protein
MRYLLLLLFVSSCSSLSRQECEDTNWYIKGLADGQDGLRDPKTKEYRDECYSHNVTIKGFDYLKGYEDGSKTFCTTENAKVIGLRGYKPHKVCEEINPQFSFGYNEGLRVFLKEKTIEDIIERYGNECISNSNCTDGKSCLSTIKSTRFSDQVSVRVCR